ncbi:MAG: hypothetical protein BHW55_03230 [Candidatus Melainabacteria bacterium 35_41]|jgi:two component transcriptional regulator, luxR family|nr:MAG: hypothetical protein BHW55_03230 [Candidatus Melainabacteria bacterium 35_41]
MFFNKNISKKLTDRERDVAELMVLGYNNREIANKLYISKSTSKAYTSKIFAKINAKNRAHACYLLGLKALV